MTDFQNLELINKAIDNYALFNKTQKNLNNQDVTLVKRLTSLCKEDGN